MSKLIGWLYRGARRQRVLVISADLAGAFLAFALAYSVMSHLFSIYGQFRPHFISLFVFASLLLLIFSLLGGYRPIQDRRPETELAIVTKGTSLGLLITLAVNFIAFKETVFSRYIILASYICAIPILFALRLLLREGLNALWRKGQLCQKVLLVGETHGIQHLVNHLNLQRHERFEYIGALTEDESHDSKSREVAIPVLGTIDNLDKVILEHSIDRVFVVMGGLSADKTEKLVTSCHALGVNVNLVSELLSTVSYQVNIDEYLGLFTLVPREEPLGKGYYRFTKRAMDLLVSLIGLPLVGALYLVFGFLIKLEDGGPILFRHRRLGVHGQEFDAFKFRTMWVNADDVIKSDEHLRKEFEQSFKIKEDPRVTRVGAFMRRYSLDEFPQLINVLKGEMSLVGPRPIVKEEAGKFGEWLSKRLSTKPGMTGFWQVGGRQETSYEERVRMDLFYIDYWSIWLDIILLLKTIWKVFRAEGAY